jgi:muconate cycloisomerase
MTTPPVLAIRRVDAIPIALPLKKPVRMADAATVEKAENLLVRIEAADGNVGWGEAASAPTMTGDTLGGLVAAVQHLAPLLVGQNALTWPRLTVRLRAGLLGNTGAHSAIEMALLDLAGRATGLSLADLITAEACNSGPSLRDMIDSGPRRKAVAPMWLIGNATPEQDFAEAEARLREGFRFFKLKVAVKSLDQDIAATHAVRKAIGPDIPLCGDANCGFAPDAARRYLEGTRDARLLFLEQPLAPEDLGSLAALTRALPVPIGADEGIHSSADIETHAKLGVGGLSLKLIKLGGFWRTLAAALLCEDLGLKVNVAAKIAESSIATAAAVHLACTVPSIDWGVSLTHFYLAEDIVKTPLVLGDGVVEPPSGSGLGVEVDEGRVARFQVA